MSTPAASPRQRLLDAATALIYQEGIAPVGVDLISETAGVSKRTLYQQFGSKDALVAAALDAAGPGIVRHYLDGAEQAGGPRDKIMAVFAALSEWSRFDGFRGCPFVNVCTELAGHDHPAHAVASRYKGELRTFFDQQARQGGATRPAELAEHLMMIFDGAAAQVVTGLARDTSAAAAAVTMLLDGHGLTAD
jgi:AcrR family transcriptional regulator